MSALTEVNFSNNQGISEMLDLNGEALTERLNNLNADDVEALFNAFDSMVADADKLDGEVIFRGHKLSRVNYGGDFMRIFGSGDRSHASTEQESTRIRTIFKAALLKYIGVKQGLERKDELKDMVNKIFSEDQKSTPLSRRTISQAVNIVKDARTGGAGAAGPAKNAMIGRALSGTWTKGVQWKLIGGSLGVKMTREHLETMLSNAMAIAKTKVEGLSKSGASALADGLKAQMDRYLKLFDANKLGGALERLVINGLDKESVANEMLRQLEKDSIPQMLGKGVKRDGSKSLGVVSHAMRDKLIALKEAEDTIGSKAILDRIQIAPDTDRAVEGMKALLKQLGFSADDLKNYKANVKAENAKPANANEVPPKDFDVLKLIAKKPELIKELRTIGTPNRSQTGEDLFGRLQTVLPNIIFTENRELDNNYTRLHDFLNGVEAQSAEQRKRNLLNDLLLNANTLDAVYYMNDGERLLARLTEDADLFSSMCLAAVGKDDGKGGNAMLDALGKVSEGLKQDFTALLAKVSGIVNPKKNAAQSPLEFKSLLFSKLDSVYKAFQASNIEQKISTALEARRAAVADQVVDQIRNVCTNKVSETDLEIVKELIVRADDISLRRMFAASLREGQGGIGGDFSPAAFIRGMGVYANKLLQGLPLKPEADVQPESKAMYDAVSKARNDLPKIDASILEAELYATLSSEGNQIQSVTIEDWLGAGSVAQTGLCKVIYKQQDGDNLVNDSVVNDKDKGKDKGADVVFKGLRPDIKEVFNNEARIVRELIRTKNNDANLLGQHHKRVTSFNEECITKKELINALRGIKQFGVPYARRGENDPKRQLTMPWKVNGTTINFTENNLVGSENLVLKAGKTMAGLQQALDALDETANDEAYEQIVNDFFLGATDTFFVIERAPGQDLAKFNATFKAEVTDNNCGLGVPKEGDVPKSIDEKINIVKQNRDTIQTLNRALTQLKSTFLKNALHTKGHFFHCDLTAGNIVFDKETGSLTIIDYGKTGHLSDDEALAMLKLENLELHIQDGVQNGKKMREAYQALLESEITRLEEKTRGYEQNPYDADEYALDQLALRQLRDTQRKLGNPQTVANLDHMFQKAFVRLDAKARGENPPQVKTSFELFADVLKNVSSSILGLDLPLPSVVRDFIDTYSRLQNGINDAQNNLNALNAKISELIVQQHNGETSQLLDSLSLGKLERLGWLNTEVKTEDNRTTVTLKSGTLDGSNMLMNFGDKSFTTRISMLNLELQDKNLSLEDRQSKLNAIKVLLGNERTRLQKTLDVLAGRGGEDYKAMTAEIGSALNLGEIQYEFEPLGQDDELKKAIKDLDDAEKAVTQEINLVSTSFASDSMFSTSIIGKDHKLENENRMLAAGHFNTDDTNIQRTSVTLTDMTVFRAAKAQAGIQNDADDKAKTTQLPPNLLKRFRELLLTSGCYDWKETMTFLANDKACTFFEYGKLLETCTTKMNTLKGKVDFSTGEAYDPEVKPDLTPLTMTTITDKDEKEFFVNLFKENDSKGVKVNVDANVKDILTSFEQLRQKIIPTIKNIDLSKFGNVVIDPFDQSGSKEIFGTNLTKLFYSNANANRDLAVQTKKSGTFPISLAIAKNYGNELTVTALENKNAVFSGEQQFITDPKQVKELKDKTDKYVPYKFNNNIDVSSIRNAIGLAVVAFPQIKEDFDLRYKILMSHLGNENLDPALRQKYQAFFDEIKQVYINDQTYNPNDSEHPFKSNFERRNSPKREMVGGKWVYEGGEMIPGTDYYKPEVLLDEQYGSVLRHHVTLLDYYRITALIGEAKTDELKLDDAGIKTYNMLQAQLKKLPGGQGNVKGVEEATFGDLGELMDRVKASFALKYKPLGEKDLASYKEFYKSTHDGQEFEGNYVSEYQCKQELNDYVTNRMGNVMQQNQYEVIDYGEGVIDSVEVKDDYLALVEGAKNLNIPGYRNDEELETNDSLSYYWQSKMEDQQFVATLKNKEYIKVAGDVERALKKQPRLNDNQALVNADLDNNADFKFKGNVEYKKFDQDDVLYMSFAPVKAEDVSNPKLQEEDGNSVIFFETGVYGGKKADYANNKLKVVQMNDLKLSRHLYDKSINLPEGEMAALQDLNNVYKTEVLDKEAGVLLGYIDRAVGMLFDLDDAGTYKNKGPYFDSVRNYLKIHVGKTSDLVNKLKEYGVQIGNTRLDENKKEEYQNLLKEVKNSVEWIKTHCKNELNDIEDGFATRLRYLRDPAEVNKDRELAGKAFKEPDLSLLPVLQELVLKLGVQDLPSENVEQQPVAA